MKWLHFALQNTMRNRRRSFTTLLIVAMGCAAMLLGGGFALYTYQSLAQMAARSTGHLIVGKPAQFLEEEDVPLQHGLSNQAALSARLLELPEVRAVLPNVSFSGLIGNGDKSIVMMALGVDPGSEFKVKGPFMKVTAGEILSGKKGAAEVMLGEGLARSLKAKPGTGLTLLASTTEGAMNAMDATVVGVFSSGVPEVDKRLVYVDLPSSQRLLHTERVSTVGVFLSEIDKSDATQDKVAKMFPELTVRHWKNEAFFYASVKNLYNRIFGALGGVLTVIVVFVIANAMAMSIIERTREIGTLRGIGTLPSQLIATFSMEGMVLGLFGSMGGCALAAAVSLGLYMFPIQMSPPPGRSTGYPLHINIDFTLYACTTLTLVALSMAASAWIARSVVSRPITEALAHT